MIADETESGSVCRSVDSAGRRSRGGCPDAAAQAKVLRSLLAKKIAAALVEAVTKALADRRPGRSNPFLTSSRTKTTAAPKGGERIASVFRRRDRWYLRVKNPVGRWKNVPSEATTKKLAQELSQKYERQRLGLEPGAADQAQMTFGSLMDWWWNEYDCHLRSATIKPFAEGHFRTTLGDMPLVDVHRQLESVLSSKIEKLSPESLNHLRAHAHRLFALPRALLLPCCCEAPSGWQEVATNGNQSRSAQPRSPTGAWGCRLASGAPQPQQRIQACRLRLRRPLSRPAVGR